MMRARSFAVVFVSLFASCLAQDLPDTAQLSADRFLQISSVPLWPNGAPGALGKTPLDAPMLAILPPQEGTGVGAAVVVFPGGGYVAEASNIEGRQVADWFASHGAAAFVLKYRYGPRYGAATSLVDAQRAIRWVRAHVAEYGIAADRIGVVGFSAGGHLAAMTSNAFHASDPSAKDPLDRVSDRPDFAILGYPAITLRNVDAKSFLCKPDMDMCDAATIAKFQADRRVTPNTPPTFIFHTTPDALVSPMDSIAYYTALQKAGVSAELHVFAFGPHGTGLGATNSAVRLWPSLMENWLREKGLLTPIAVERAVPTDTGPLSLESSLGRILRDQVARTVLRSYVGEAGLEELEAAKHLYARPLKDLVLYRYGRMISDHQIKALDHDLRKIRNS
jgi:acetyl esterase/lipase